MLELANFPVVFVITLPCSSFNGAPAPGLPQGLYGLSLGLTSRIQVSSNTVLRGFMYMKMFVCRDRNGWNPSLRFAGQKGKFTLLINRARRVTIGK